MKPIKLIYLQEETPYTPTDIIAAINNQLKWKAKVGSPAPDPGDDKSELLEDSKADSLVQRLKKSMDNGLYDEDETTVVKETKNGYSFRFIGLYDYVDAETNVNLTFFFMPKFVSEKAWNDWNPDEPNPDAIRKKRDTIRDTVLQAIDRRNRELSKSDDQTEETEERRESLLERAVRVLRDYLENGVYTVQRRELEHNGQGEIEWETTIDKYQPVFLKRGGKVRPFYMDYDTKLACSDEEHYITRLHQCLVTTWGRKLEELGLSSVLRVNVPLLSEEELDWFGEPDYQIAQIDRELRLQFVTKSRRTLSLMKDLIRATAENKAANRQSLSFGMNGAAQLWETAIKDVFGDQMEKKPGQLQLNCKTKGDTKLKDFIEPPKWTESGVQYDEDDDPVSGSRLRPDFIAINNTSKHLVILDAKYYLPKFDSIKEKKIVRDCPGVGDIDKQFLYQLSFAELCEKNDLRVLNAFVFPNNPDDGSEQHPKPVWQFATITVDLFSWILVQLGKLPENFKDCLSEKIVAFKVDGTTLFQWYAEGLKQSLECFLPQSEGKSAPE